MLEYSKKINIGILTFLLGTSVTISFISFVESKFEDEILDSIIERINPNNNLSEEKLIDSTIKFAHSLQELRTSTIGQHNFNSLKTKFFKSSLESFYIGTGACGNHSIFAARLFSKMGFLPKIIHQKNNGYWGAHITLAIPLKNGRLGLTDPLFKHVFVDSNGNIADIHSVKNEWDYFKKQVPAKYDKQYDYQEGYRLTNWDKLGFISRFFYSTGIAICGKQTMELFCIRVYLLDIYQIQFFISILISAFFVFLIYRKTKKSQIKNTTI
jgi:hypothetical protein